MRMSLYRFRWIFASVIITMLVVLSACAASPVQNASNTTSPTQNSAISSPVSFIDAVARDIPSIVKIEVQYNPQQNPAATSGATGGAGTGWVVNKGFVVTNDHVIAGAQTVSVVLSDGTRLTPIAARSNSTKDIAVLKINDQNLAPLSIGDSKTLKLGQPVAAIGNALDLGIRVTTGVVSMLNLAINTSNFQYSGLIETDAAINPGNSGGVLIAENGDVMGITNAGLQDSNLDPENFGYAINIDEAMPVIQNLISQMP